MFQQIQIQIQIQIQNIYFDKHTITKRTHKKMYDLTAIHVIKRSLDLKLWIKVSWAGIKPNS